MDISIRLFSSLVEDRMLERNRKFFSSFRATKVKVVFDFFPINVGRSFNDLRLIHFSSQCPGEIELDVVHRLSTHLFIRSLGRLNFIRLWHDNSGPGPSASWYLKYVLVRDLQTMNKFDFIVQRWFAVEKDDGLIERTIPLASQTEREQFSYLLSKKVSDNVSDNHLWFSIFSRPASNPFTRVQRCTCSFAFLFISMLFNIIYYDLSNQTKILPKSDGNSLSLGPFFISTQEVRSNDLSHCFTALKRLK